MKRLVEDIGPSWCAGRFGAWRRFTGATTGTATIGSRTLAWTYASVGAVDVTHADANGAELSYKIATVTTAAPNTAARLWWSCPACARRSGLLYLPDDWDRLACRTCCGLSYASQHPNVRRGPIKSVPVFTLETTTACWGQGAGWRSSRRVRTYPGRR